MNFPIGYGMNPEQSQPTTAEPEPQEPVQETAKQAIKEAVACPTLKRRRARVKGGRFASDDPSTAANEAWSES
ncbi:hypothetical protein LBMAG40_00680 [Cyanobium sp.]|nr:hypothetical protein LBMAG40_00680 [Cyanobium sp.]